MLRPIAPFIEYAIHQDYIAEFLCINKEKPEMQCNGKCHLYKEVEKQQQEAPTPLRISIEEYPIGFVKILTIEQKKIISLELTKYFFYSKNYNYIFSELVFHPPIV